MITPDELEIIDMPKSSLKVKHPITGVEGYRVGLEVFHQLHCLNLLRQVTYRDWYEDISGNFKAGPEALQMHTGESTTSPITASTTQLTELRSLFGGVATECSVQCGCRSIHVLHVGGRSTALAGAEFASHL